MEEISSRFPEGVTHVIPYDTTLFVEASIEEVVMTFIEAIILVILVVYLFLQHARATIIPIVAVPVSLIRTFAVMSLSVLSLNLLSLFGLVLSIGSVFADGR